MLLQRLATGATGVTGKGLLGQRGHSYAHAQYTLVAVQCETMHGVMPIASSALKVMA